MTLATANRIVRKHGGKFDEKGEFTHVEKSAPHRYRCGCHPKGFTAGQVVKHFKFCPYHPDQLIAFQRRSRFAYFVLALAIGVIGAAIAVSFLMHV